ncbi:hypothetical protein LB523_12145 [Mesorhizobium sp. ESP-6-4]|uniref:hypothetical protein n=1 Tax=Mesorhizobium sp. ESP-6-4 TaxID=2876624 RepID=UPI001CC94F0E|nr:hypothetical protein [Mesorhizobium sp. ESP-6-4]MBZ9659797.1 hypothetical protein [Mesorhizobium sp. ESP-6-4]
MLNLPLSKRGAGIDVEIDRYKRDLAKRAKTYAKASAAQAKIDRAAAHALLDAADVSRIQHLATKCSQTLPAMRKHLRAECHWQPKLVISLLA